MIVGNVLIPVADLDEAIAFYGLPVKFRDGDRFAALNGGGSPWRWPGPPSMSPPRPRRRTRWTSVPARPYRSWWRAAPRWCASPRRAARDARRAA